MMQNPVQNNSLMFFADLIFALASPGRFHDYIEYIRTIFSPWYGVPQATVFFSWYFMNSSLIYSPKNFEKVAEIPIASLNIFNQSGNKGEFNRWLK